MIIIKRMDYMFWQTGSTGHIVGVSVWDTLPFLAAAWPVMEDLLSHTWVENTSFVSCCLY